MSLEIAVFPCLDTNIGILLRETETGKVASIDAPDANAVEAELQKRKWRLDHILITHCHSDHVQGLDVLKKRYNCRVVAPSKGRDLLKTADLWVSEGDKLRLGSLQTVVLATPGHCQDHVVYWFESAGTLFAGDCLFALGCGRVFGGDFQAMWTSLQKLADLPDETKLYYGHDYALANGRFAIAVEPDNAALQERIAQAKAERDAGRLFVPSTIGEEKRTNPFLRANLPSIAHAAGMGANDDPADVFKALREWKDRF